MVAARKSVGSDKLVGAATIVTRRKPTDVDASEPPATRRRKTTTKAFIPYEIILSIPTDKEALAYVSSYPESINKSTKLMARFGWVFGNPPTRAIFFFFF